MLELLIAGCNCRLLEAQGIGNARLLVVFSLSLTVVKCNCSTPAEQHSVTAVLSIYTTRQPAVARCCSKSADG
jgi:hypothetical protein